MDTKDRPFACRFMTAEEQAKYAEAMSKYEDRQQERADVSKAANALGKRLIGAIAKYTERNGARPTHMEVTEEELLIIGPHLGGYWHLGNKEQKLDGVELVVVKRRMGRAAEPVIEWEGA